MTSSASLSPDQIRHRAASKADLGSLNDRLARLKADVLPASPYLLTVPTNVPFSLGGRCVNNWAVGKDSLFVPEEQQLQYMSFLMHHDSDSLLVATGDWADANGNIMTEDAATKTSTPTTTTTATTTTNGTAAAVTPSGISAAAETSEKAAESKPAAAGPPSSLTEQTVEGPSKPKEPEQPDPQPPSPKRRKLTPPEPEPEPEKQPATPPSSSKPRNPVLPALLSPTLPPSASPSPKLPRLLSPTLPPELEEELNRLQNSQLQNGTTESAKGPHSESVSSAGTQTATKNADRKPTRVDEGRSDANPKPQPSAANGRNKADSSPSLVVKLRYGRGNRRLVEGILKLPSKRKATGVVFGGPPREKRQRLEQEDKEDKASTSEAPKKVTKLAVTKTPTVTTPTAKATPSTSEQKKREATSVSEARTPLSTSSKPNGTAKASPTPATSERPPRESERQSWRSEFQKFAALGRELKHASDRYTRTATKSEKNSPPTADEKLAAATAVEAILCFMLAFIADDRAKALARQVGDSGNWRSILAYWRVVRLRTAGYRGLHGLCSLLGAVSHDAIHALDLDRLAVMSLPDDDSNNNNSNSNRTPTPAATPGSTDESKKQQQQQQQLRRRDLLDLKTRLPESHREAQRLWQHGLRELSEEVLTTEFPETWRRRTTTTTTLESSDDRGLLKPGQYAGSFALPFSRATAPVEVVRCGVSLLAEWCVREGLDGFEPRLKL